MKNIIFTKGIIASGKSSWSKKFISENQNYKRISRDDIRHMISNYTFNSENENLVTKIENSIIIELMNSPYDIIFDKQNLNQKQLEKDINFLKSFNKEINIEIKEFPISLSEAIERDKKREFSIGEKVIKETWNKYEVVLKEMLEKSKHILIQNENLDKCIICDIDGTLSNSYQRKIFNYEECINDIVITPVKNVINCIKKFCNVKVFLFSGREDIYEKETIEWLKKNNISYDFLFLRKEKDYRDDTIIKEEMFNEHIRDKYYCLGIIDDRKKVIKHWIEMGLFVFDVSQDPFGKNNF